MIDAFCLSCREEFDFDVKPDYAVCPYCGACGRLQFDESNWNEEAGDYIECFYLERRPCIHVVIPHCALFHPVRRVTFDRLRQAFDHPQIVITERPEHSDPAQRLRERNVWLAWQEPWPEGATARLLLEDDMMASPGAAEALLRIVDRFGAMPIAPFSFSPITRAGYERGVNLVRWKWFGAGGAMLLPRELAEDFAQNPPEGAGVKPTDRLLNEYIERRDLRVLNVAPSLFDHVDPGSELHSRKRPVLASIAFGPYASALDVDWGNCPVADAEALDMIQPVSPERNWVRMEP